MRRTMDWSRLQHTIPFEKNFRWRGGQVSRIEAFADAVFALSVTLLVVSTEVPTSYEQLIEAMRAAPAFALSFALIVMIWFFHFIHFRRYGVEDGPTMFLNIALLFVVLIYVYPLKFMWGFLATWWGGAGIDEAMRRYQMDPQGIGGLLVIYGVGFVAIFALLALLGRHALKLRDELELNEVEVVMTRSLITGHWISAAVGLLSVGMALSIPSPYTGMAGMVYMTLPILQPLHGYLGTKRENAAVERMNAAGRKEPGVTGS